MFQFWRDASPQARRALAAASIGWMLDAFDVLIYALVLTAIRKDLQIGANVAGGADGACFPESRTREVRYLRDLDAAADGEVKEIVGRVHRIMAS